MSKFVPAILFSALLLGGCITTDNPVIQAGDGTPDVTQCAVLDNLMVQNETYVPLPAGLHGADQRLHPDIFYLGWSQLDARNDLRFPARGFDGDGFEDKLLVSRKVDGEFQTWQLLPRFNENCEDNETIRIHSFDVGPGGTSLFISMRRGDDPHLAICEFDFTK